MKRTLLVGIPLMAVAVAAVSLAATRITEGKANLERRTALAREQLQGALARGEYRAVATAELPPRLRNDRVALRIQEAARDSLDARDERRRAHRVDSLTALLDRLPGTATRRRLEACDALVALRPTDRELRAERDRLHTIVRREHLQRTMQIRAVHTERDPGGATSLMLVWRNLSPRPAIKARFWVVPVDDDGAVLLRFGGRSSRRAVEQATTVPAGQMCCRNHFFRGLWRDPRVQGARLDSVELVFEDGSTERIGASELSLIGG